MAELGNPLKSANFGEVGVLHTVQQLGLNVTFRSRRVTEMRVVPQVGLKPAQRINDFSVDHHLEVEVAAGRGAGGSAHRHHIAAGNLLAHADV